MRIVLCCFFAILLAATTLCHADMNAELNKIVAVVNGEIITKYDLQARSAAKVYRAGLNPLDAADAERIKQIELATLDDMILNVLVLQEAERYNLLVEDSAVDNELRTSLARMQITEEALVAKLKSNGETLEFYRETIRDNIMRQKLLALMVSRKVVVTKQDIEAYYEQNKREFMQDKSVDLRLLVFAPNTDPEPVLKAVREGDMVFADAVRQHSIGPAAQSGGFIGTLEWASLIQEWRQAIEGLPAGSISRAVVYEGHTAFLYVDAITDGKGLDVDEVAERIEKKIREPLLKERFKEYIHKLRERAMVEIRL